MIDAEGLQYGSQPMIMEEDNVSEESKDEDEEEMEMFQEVTYS